MITFIQFLFTIFTFLLVFEYLRYYFGYGFPTVVVVPTITILVLLAAAYGLVNYAEAQGKSDFIKNTCNTTVTPLTVIFQPDLAEAELDYCLDAGKQPTSINP